MTIEQKAKAYDKAFGRAKALYDKGAPDSLHLEEMFPILKEDEDERIRKELIEYIKDQQSSFISAPDCRDKYEEEENNKYNFWITWLEKQSKGNIGISEATKEKLEDNLNKALEKETPESWNKFLDEQGEQKPIDKVEPKFKVKYAGSEYNVFETKDIAGVTFYGIEDEPNHIDYVKAENCDIISGYAIKENGSPYPIKSAVFSEQKPTDKIELKFHKGDWVVYEENIYQIHNISLKKYYECLRTDGIVLIFDFEYIDSKSHLWTIKDAKDGDVLACNNGWSCIFKTLVNDETFSSYCFMDSTKWFCETGGCHTLKEEFVKAYNGKIYPATKEQRNLLFQKMKETGYEWDAKRKELKKIDTYCQNNCKGFQETGKCFCDGECKAKKEYNLQDNNFSQIEQKPIEWNEEDKKHFDNIIQELKNQYDRPINASYKEVIISDIDWFKSLKYRVQSKQGWSEEDNRICKAIIDNIKAICKEGYFVGNISSDKLIDWLKSLRFQKQWKPSKEQLHYLSWISNIKLGDSVVEQEVSKHLNELYKQLKQL